MANPTSKGLEWFIHASVKQVVNFGKISLSAAGIGIFEDGELSTTGVKLYAVSLNKVGGGSPSETSTPITITVTGKDDSATPVTINGTATIPANAPLGYGIEVVVAGNKKWTDVTNITCTGGLRRDNIGVYSIPDSVDFEYLKWVDSLTMSATSSSQAIPNRYEGTDHYKRIRAEKTLELGDVKYTSFLEGALKYTGSNITLKAKVLEDGIGPAKETYIFGTFRFDAGITVAEDNVSTPTSNGKYQVIIHLDGDV